jgi:hypothetical protein
MTTMSETKCYYGNLTSGKVVAESDVPGSIELTEWTPGYISSDGKFHPYDPTKRAASGHWVVVLSELAQ